MIKTAATLLFASMIVATSAPAGEWDDFGEMELAEAAAKVAALIEDTERFVWLGSDPVKRAIICRIAYEGHTPRELIRASGVSKMRVWAALGELTNRRVVRRMNIFGQEMIMPYDEAMALRLRDYAERWCYPREGCEK